MTPFRFAAVGVITLLVSSPVRAADIDPRLVGTWRAALPCDEENSRDCEYSVISAQLAIEPDGRYRWSYWVDLMEDVTEGQAHQIAADSITFDERLRPYFYPEIEFRIDGNALTMSERMDDGSVADLFLHFERGPLGLHTIDNLGGACKSEEVDAQYTENAVTVGWTSDELPDFALSDAAVADIVERNGLLTAAVEAYQGQWPSLLLNAWFSSVEGDATGHFLRVSAGNAEFVKHTDDGYYSSLMTCVCPVSNLRLKVRVDGTWRFVRSARALSVPAQIVFSDNVCASHFP